MGLFHGFPAQSAPQTAGSGGGNPGAAPVVPGQPHAGAVLEHGEMNQMRTVELSICALLLAAGGGWAIWLTTGYRPDDIAAAGLALAAAASLVTSS